MGLDDDDQARYEDLVSLFREWRMFQKPKVVDGVPDYGASAMSAQQRELETYRRRLASIDVSGWPVAQQVDYQVAGESLRPRSCRSLFP